MRGSIPPSDANWRFMKINLEYPFTYEFRDGYVRVCSDGRKRIDLVRYDGTRTTLSYSIYLMGTVIGYEITPSYEVDHIDRNCSNDDIDNLQILSVKDHSAKTSLENSTGRTTVKLTCPVCGCDFEREKRHVRVDKPKCSRSCNAKYSRNNSGWFPKK